jgi:CBS domain-containing protein
MMDVKILRVFMGESAHKKDRPVHELIVEEARKRGMAGATVVRGFMGFGANSLVHTAKILRLSEDLPVIVEIVDVPERVTDFLPLVEELVDEGSIVLQEGKALMHCPMRIRDVMIREVSTIAPDTSLDQAAKLLLHGKFKALPVLENGKIVGIITGGDLLQRAAMPLRLDVQRQLPDDMRAEQMRLFKNNGLRAKDIMTTPVVTINVKTRVAEALAQMVKRDIKRLPVVDDDGRLMGIVSRIDVLRAIARAAAVTRTLPELPQGLLQTAKDIMYRDVPVATLDTPLPQVLASIVATPLRRVVVIDAKRKVLGIVLDRDMVALYAKMEKPGVLRSLIATLSPSGETPSPLEGTARDVMKTQVFTVSPDAPLIDVVAFMVDKRAKRLVVVDAENRLLGMVDREAVMRVLAAK